MNDGSAAAFLVLLVGDEPAALRLIQEAILEAGQPAGYIVARDRPEAFDVLYGRGPYALTRRPDLVLLDFDLSGSAGWSLLAELNDDDAPSVPVVVLSGDDDDATIAECYRLGANAYIEKPMDYDGILAIVESLIDFWGAETSAPPE